MSATNRLCACLRKAKVLHLARLDQILHGAGGLLNRRVGIDAVLVEKIDSVRLQTLQRAFDGLLDMGGPTVSCCPLAIVAGIGFEPELGSDHDVFAKGSESFTDDYFIDERAVHFCSVEESDTAFN